jgi:acylpyruvate hydrolase
MRLLTFVAGDGPRLGIETGGGVVDLAAAWELFSPSSRGSLPAMPSVMIDFLRSGEPALAAARQVEARFRSPSPWTVAPASPGSPRVFYGHDEFTIVAPIASPGKVVCLGLNYPEHAAESGEARPTLPILFAKFANAIVGPGEPIRLPGASGEVDFEAEMAFVIGRRARNVSAEDALAYVAGYTTLNDVSARDLQFETSQWLRGKTPDTFAPTGPYLVTRDEVPDPQNLDVKLWLNGELMQDSNTCQQIFTVKFLVQHITKTVTLEPGDIISTGTPSGVGFKRKPPVFLKPGDVVRIQVGNLGVLENPVVAGE